MAGQLESSTRLRVLERFDWILLLAVIVLLALGLASIWSVALSREPPDLFLVRKQMAAAILGLVLIFFLTLANYRLLKNYALLLGLISIILLGAVLFLGRPIRGTTAWFSFAGWNFQPVELAKFSLVVFLAKYLEDHPRASFLWREFLISSLASGGLIFLVLLEPDLGSALILAAVWLGLLAFARIRLQYLFSLILTGCLLALAAWFFILAPYQKDRIQTFLDPGHDPLGRGYNVEQAIIAVGSGGVWGRGLGFGSQTQLRFLPESQTDFIFAVMAEQFGLVGVMMTLFFFGLIFYRLLCLAREAADDFSAFLSLGILLILVIQFVINVGMNLGLLPVAGLGLPFVSYGGSALVVFLLMIGVAESIAVRRPLIGKSFDVGRSR